MSSYVASTERLILSGTFPEQAGFREAWVADEAFKWERLAAHPGIQDAVHQLEDNSLVRGRIMAFDLDPAKLSSRANAFAAVSGPSCATCSALRCSRRVTTPATWVGVGRSANWGAPRRTTPGQTC